jgi:hypothetical protein
MNETPPQAIPPFEQPENPLLKLPTETPHRRTRPVRKVGPQPPIPLGAIMPDVAVEMRRRELDRLAAAQQAAFAEDLDRTAEQS